MDITDTEIAALSTAGVLGGLFPNYARVVRELDDGSTANEDHGNLTFGDGAPSNAVQKTTAALVKLRAGTLDVMSPLRQAAFTAAMAYGNAITDKVTSRYADAETRSWTVQEAEARAVLADATLPDGAMLPQLAKDKGVALKDYAQTVVANADAYRQIAVAAVRLRRGAEGLLSADLDTPEKLEVAVEALRAQALAAAAAVGLAV